MADHKGFAVAFSISRNAVQQFVHAAFVNDIIATRYRGARNMNGSNYPFPFLIEYDLYLADPHVVLEPNSGDDVRIEVEVLGDITCSAPGHPTRACEVKVTFTLGMKPVIVENRDQGTLQFGLDPTRPEITSYKSKRL